MSASISPFPRLHDLYKHLRDDYEFARAQLKGDPSNQALRRSFVRAAFAFIEGALYGMKHGLVAGNFDNLSMPEKACLAEETYSINAKGEVSVGAVFPSTPENIRFTFACMSKAFGVPYAPELRTDAGWTAVRDSTSLRNHLMHPKDPQALEVAAVHCRPPFAVADQLSN